MTSLEITKKRIELHELCTLIEETFRREGCDDANSRAVAQTLLKAERDGATSHGVFRLPGYLASLRSGKVNGHAKPKIDVTAPSILRIDGDGGFAPLAHQLLLDPLERITRSQGIAMAAIQNTYHFSALWIELEMLAERGLVAFACTSYKPALPPAGGKKPLYGTNPIAFAWPRTNNPPLVFDQASSVVARGEVMLAARDGRQVAAGIGIDPDGLPTTEPEAILKGALLPYGGYKGASIALMVELLAGPLLGECLSIEAAKRDNNDGGPPRGGEFILAISPERTCGSSRYLDHAEVLFSAMLSESGVRLPGDSRRRKRTKIEESGVEIEDYLLSILHGKK